MAIQVVILAAGQGKRMRSSIPKVLHTLAGRPLLEHVVRTAIELSDKPPIVVYGYQGDRVQRALDHLEVRWCKQEQQLGTAHALLQALPEVAAEDHVLVLYGDVPLISHSTLTNLIEETGDSALGLVTATIPNPKGYGRILRNADDRIIGITEEKDALEEEKTINEINSGIYYVPAHWLQDVLPQLENDNAQQEYYLTDIVIFAATREFPIHDVSPNTFEEIQGVNERLDLARLERFYQLRQAYQLMQQGVHLLDPTRLDVRGEVHIGEDVSIDVNVILEGRVEIGNGCTIGPHVILRNTKLDDDVEIKAHSIIDGAEIARNSTIGPFARLRPGTVIAADAHVGNFVEIKNSEIGVATKINHLSYIGDSEIGDRVNIGAGTITCNYDGVNKHKTIIGHDTHVGSDTQFVAPVRVGEGATIAAGSTITKDVPPHQLTLTQKIEQRSIKDWIRPTKKPQTEPV